MPKQQQEKSPRTVSPPKIIYPSVTEVQLYALTDNKRRTLYTKKVRLLSEDLVGIRPQPLVGIADYEYLKAKNLDYSFVKRQ